MEKLRREVATGVVEGSYDERFESVVDEFVRNFAERGELGASTAIVFEGETVVDVWGGCADPTTNTPWERDTMCVVFSCTKGATAMCAHLLAARGQLDLEAPVASVWPEFAAGADGSKERARIRMMLDHSVGVPVLRGEVADGELYDWDRMVARLEAEPPFWEPGIRNGYHMINFGWTVGELVRRASRGRSLGTYFREEIAEPLGVEFWIGLPEEHEGRVARIQPYERQSGEPLNEFAKTLLADPKSIPALAMTNTLGFRVNSRDCHAAEIGGGGGISNGRGLAGLYAPLSLGGGSLFSSADVDRMRRISTATNDDATLRIPSRFALGFMVSMDNRAIEQADSVIMGEHAFGHVGAGGSIGFADPSIGLAVGYAMNKQGRGILMNERGQSLIDAAYRCATA